MPALRELLARQHLPHLLDALEGHPGLGWVLKQTPSLAYARWSGAVPMADSRLSRAPAAAGLSAGQTDADHFDPTQASILRLADLRALRQGMPASEVHRIETRSEEIAETAADWRAWRLAFDAPAADPAAPPVRWLLVVWRDVGYAALQDVMLDQAQRQIQAQQLLIAQLRAEIPAESGLSGSDASLTWAAQRFTEQLRREIDLSRREQRSFALILVTLGPDKLDTNTQQAITGLLARQLPLGVRTMDTVAQIGPSKFGVLLSGAQLTPAFARAEALRRQAAEQVVMVGGPARTVELFIGVAAYPLTSDDAGVLLSSAEQALDEACANGRGCTVLARVPLAPPPEAGSAV